MFNMRHIDQQGSGNLHPDPSIILGGAPNNQQPNIHANLPEHLGSAMYYGMPQYNATPFYSSGSFPSSLNHGSFDHFHSSSNHGVMGGPADEYGRNVYTDKRKNADGFPGHFNRFEASASSSSSVAPMNTNRPAIIEVGFHQSARNMSGAIGLEPVMPPNPSQFVQGNYMGGFQRAGGSVWREQQPGSNGSDGIAPAWNQAPAVGYLPNNMNGGFMENGNMCLPGYHEIFNSRGSTSYLPPPPFHHHYPPPPPPLMPGGRGQNINFFPQHPTNSIPHNMMNPHDVETTARRVGPALQTSLRMFRTRHGGAEATQRDHNLPYLRVLPAEEVAILEISEFHEVANHIDHHRDLRLDIEDMSYEELLGLGERIGNVSTGLTEETINRDLKTRIFSTRIDLEREPPADDEFEPCIICQSDYENQEKIGTLDCGHEYHAECLKTWLLVKNVCPICKASALRKDIH